MTVADRRYTMYSVIAENELNDNASVNSTLKFTTYPSLAQPSFEWDQQFHSGPSNPAHQ